MKVDLLVKNAQVVNAWGRFEGWVAVQNGTVVAMGNGADAPDADQVINVQGKYVLPGAIEPHTHYGVYRPFEEDMEYETRSAAVGGVTTVFTSIINPESYLDTIDNAIRLVQDKALVDVTFNAFMLSPVHIDEMNQYADKGVSSFKYLMAYKGEEGRQIGIQGADDGYLLRGFEAAARLGYPALPMIHAENSEICWEMMEKMKQTGRVDLGAWADGRPDYAESTDFFKAAQLAEVAKSPVYIVHVSSAKTVQLIAKAKARGKKVIAETCPQYLNFTRDAEFGILGKVNPSIKEQKDSDMLWWGLANGVIDCMGTDHCCLMEKDKRGQGDIWSALPGFPGTATMLPSLLSEGVNKGRLTLEQVVAITSYNTAKAFGMLPRKGLVAVGSDADFAIVDLDLEQKVSAAMLQSASDFTLFDGWTLKGWPTITAVRGNVVFKDGKIIGKAGTGRFVARKRNQNTVD
jgi:dihydropyrimidinase